MKAGPPQTEAPIVLCCSIEMEVSTLQVILELLVPVERSAGQCCADEHTSSPSGVDPLLLGEGLPLQEEGLVLRWNKLEFSLTRQEATGKCCGLELLSRSHAADSTHYIALPTTLEFSLHQHSAASSLDM